MKKVFAVVAVIIIAVLLGAPKFIASQYHSQITNVVTQINDQANYSAKIVSSDSSWFGSKDTIAIHFDLSKVDPSYQGQSLEAEFLIDTRYGPILLSPQGAFGLFSSQVILKSDKQRDYLDWDKALPLYQLNVISGFSGDIKLADHIPAFSSKDKTLSVSAYSGQGHVSGEKIAYQSHLDEIRSDDQFASKASDIGLKIDLNTNWQTIKKGGFYDGEIRLKVGGFSTQPNVDLNGLVMTINTALDKKTQLGKLQVGYFVKHFTSEGVEFNDLNLTTELNNLNNKVFTDYGQLIKESPNLTADELFAFVQQNLAALLDSKPEFNVLDFSATTPKGHFKSSLTSKLGDMETPSIDDLYDPRFWLYNAIIQANVTADAPLVKSMLTLYVARKMFMPVTAPQVIQQTQLILDSLIQQGIVKQQQNELITEFQAKDGMAKIYDVQFPLM